MKVIYCSAIVMKQSIQITSSEEVIITIAMYAAHGANRFLMNKRKIIKIIQCVPIDVIGIITRITNIYAVFINPDG